MKYFRVVPNPGTIALTIVPFFNEEQFLDQSVNRLLSNDVYTSIYLIDNNSTDNSFEIAENLANKHEKIELFKTFRN